MAVDERGGAPVTRSQKASGVGLGLSVVALLLAVMALAPSLVIAGTFTHYLNSVMDPGWSPADRIVNGSIAAVFYPS